MDFSLPLIARIGPDGRLEWCEGKGEWIRWVDPRAAAFRHIPLMKQLKEQEIAAALLRADKNGRPELQDYTLLVDHFCQPRINVRSQQLEFNGQPIKEEAFEHAHGWLLKDHGLRFRKEDLKTAIRYVASEREFDPVKAELDRYARSADVALGDEEWEGIARLCFSLDGEWEGKVLRRWLISAVARVYEPGCKVDQALILFGKQGLGKSSFFRLIGGEYFSDSLGDLQKGKDDLQVLHRCWIAEWGEVDQVFAGAQKAEQVKRFVSAQQDDFRPPYGRNVRPHPRRTVIVGSTNRDDWATDHTGNRRYPVLEPKDIDRDWISENRARILGRAVAEYRKGAPWWFSAEEEAEITRRTADYAPEDPDAAELIAFFERNRGEAWTTREIWMEALGREASLFDQRVARRVGRSLASLASLGIRSEYRQHFPRKASAGAKGHHKVWFL